MSVYAVIPADLSFVRKQIGKASDDKKIKFPTKDSFRNKGNSIASSATKDGRLNSQLVWTKVVSSSGPHLTKNNYNSLIQSIVFQQKRRKSKLSKYANALSTIYEGDAPAMPSMSSSLSGTLSYEIQEVNGTNEDDPYCSECDAFFL